MLNTFKLYHVSKDLNLNKLTPRIPENIMNNENDIEERICVSMSINGCLTALGKYHNEDVLGVYEIEFTKEEFLEKVKQPSYKEVLDSPLTGELWILEEVLVKLLMKIKIKEIIYNKFSGLDNELVMYDLIK